MKPFQKKNRTKNTINFLITHFFIFSFSLLFMNCSTPGNHYPTPQATLAAGRHAIQEKKALAFLDILSVETRQKHETTFLLGWKEVQDLFSFLAEDVEIAELDQDYTLASFSDEDIPEEYVWPTPHKPSFRLRLKIPYKGQIYWEDFLFVQEVDPEEKNTKNSQWIQVGLHEYLRSQHPTPYRYQTPGKSLQERTNWRILYPYYPFQSKSKLAATIVQELQEAE